MQSGQYTVTGGGVLQHDHMSGLLAAEGESTREHGLQNVPVSHLGLFDVNPVTSHCLYEAQIAHHRRDHGVVLESAVVTQRECQDRQDLVAIHDVACGIHRKAAVGISVQRNAKIGSVLEHRCTERIHVG